MPAWPGGPCPGCGLEMPPRLVHCRNCRRLLNEDLREGELVKPEFSPLSEVPGTPATGRATSKRSGAAARTKTSPSREAAAEPRGVYDGCPACGRELRINRKYAGQMVRCKHCHAGFALPASLAPLPGRRAYYADCPHCRQELRIGAKYYGTRVACKHCGGAIRFGTAADAAASP